MGGLRPHKDTLGHIENRYGWDRKMYGHHVFVEFNLGLEHATCTS